MTRMLRGLFTLIFMRLVPLVLMVGIAWSGYQVVQSVIRQFDERTDYEDRRTAFAGTATALSPMEGIALVVGASTNVPETGLEVTESIAVTASMPTVEEPTTIVPTETIEVTVTASVEETRDVSIEGASTATETPTDLASATATDMPTETPLPTDTPEPPTATDEPTETPSEEPTVIETEAQPVSQMQIFVTNTSIPVVFATNTPVSGRDATDVPVSPTIAVIATQTPAPTLVPTETATALPTATETQIPVTPTSAATVPPVPTVFFANNPPEGAESRGTAVPTVVPTVPRNYDLVNVILLGGDDGLTDDNFNRTDTMLIVSINRDTGTVSMLSLPRDMFVYLPSGTMERLNVAYAVGENIGWTDGGFGLLRQTILYNFGINVHYYARVDFNGFEEIINSLGGVEIAVDCDYQDYALIGAELHEDAIPVDDEGLYVLPVGYYEMDGAEALWYARTRANSSDFDRGRRQQQLIRSIWRAVRDGGQLNLINLPNLWSQATSVVETDLTLDVIASLLPIALDIDVSDVQNYTLIRTYHTIPWQPPDGAFVQLPVYETLRPLLEDFYQPPPESQLALSGASIAVYNGSSQSNLDLVAADRLAWEGFNAIAYGEPDEDTEYDGTVLIDRAGQQRGSRLNDIAQILNVRAENIIVDPDPDRVADFEVYVGQNYDSCDAAVLSVDVPNTEESEEE